MRIVDVLRSRQRSDKTSEPDGQSQVVDLSGLLLYPDDDEFLREAYRRVLGREADIIGFLGFRQRLRQHLPRQAVLRALAESPEAVQTGRTYINMPSGGILASRFGRLGSIVMDTVRSARYGMHNVYNGLVRRPIAAIEHKLDYLLEDLDRKVVGVSRKLDEHTTAIAGQVRELRSAMDQGLATQEQESERQAMALQELAAESRRTQAEFRALAVELRGTWEAVLAGARHEAVLLRTLEEKGRPSLPPVILSSNGVLVTEVSGLIIGVPADEWRTAAWHVFRGPLEPGLAALVQTLVKPGMVVVDVGANVGFYTLLAARLVGPGGRVHGFEPAPTTFALLRENVQVNGFLESGVVQLHQEAVLDVATTATLKAFPGNCGHNTLFGAPGTGVDIRVPTVPLDEALGEEDHIDFVKIDAEGAEPYILAGMRRTIQKNPALRIAVEFAPAHLCRAGVAPRSFLRDVRDLGLRIRRIDDLTGGLQEVDDTVLMESISANVLLDRPEGALGPR